MRLKKNVFGYINFSLGTLIMSVYLYVMCVSLLRFFEENAGKRIYVMGVKLSNIGGLGLVLLAALIFFLLYFIKSKITVNKFKGSGLLFGLVYWFSFAFLFSYGLYARISGLGILKQWNTVKNYTESVTKPGYWQNLLNLFYGEQVSFDNFFHKAYSYVAALFLRIFGDNLTVPAILNIFLFMGSAVLLFFSAMFIFGKVPAIFCFGALMLSELPLSFLFEISGFNLFFFALSLLIFLVTYILDVYTGSKPVMCYIISFLTLIAALAMTHFGFISFAPIFEFNLNVLNFRPSDNIYISIAITVLALFGFLSFVKTKEDEISFANILLVVLLLILMFDYSLNNTYMFMIVTFCIIAGIGFDNLLFKNYKAVPVTEDESDMVNEFSEELVLVPEEELEISADSAEVPVASVEVHLEPVKNPTVELIPEEVATAPEEEPEENVGVITVSNLVGAVKAPEEEPMDTEPEKHVVPSSFETPLPMPKKHVKKTFEYAFEPSVDLLKYDVEISPDDDFDIK